jgi:rhomboid protease GluP
MPRAGYYVTPILAAAITAVFVMMAFEARSVVLFPAKQLINWGANYRPLLEEGQWFRLITSLFVHGGIAHLLMNLYGVFFAGITLERTIGPARVAIIYLLSGAAGSITSSLVHPATVSVGASGAIFGLYGALVVIMIVRNFGRSSAFAPILQFVVFLVASLLIGAGKIGIDNAAHLGGLAAGLILGGIIAALPRRKPV